MILIYTTYYQWHENMISGDYKFSNCPVSRCILTENKEFASAADALVFKDYLIEPKVSRPPNQIWIMSHMDSPKRTKPFPKPNVFNWTATYRTDSTIPKPYNVKWVYYDESVSFAFVLRIFVYIYGLIFYIISIMSHLEKNHI